MTVLLSITIFPSAEGGGLYVNAYEVSFPFGENVERPQPVYFNQSEPILEGNSWPNKPHTHPYLIGYQSYFYSNLYLEISVNRSTLVQPLPTNYVPYGFTTF